MEKAGRSEGEARPSDGAWPTSAGAGGGKAKASRHSAESSNRQPKPPQTQHASGSPARARRSSNGKARVSSASKDKQTLAVTSPLPVVRGGGLAHALGQMSTSDGAEELNQLTTAARGASRGRKPAPPGGTHAPSETPARRGRTRPQQDMSAHGKQPEASKPGAQQTPSQREPTRRSGADAEAEEELPGRA